MINSKNDYLKYIKEDRVANKWEPEFLKGGKSQILNNIILIIKRNPIERFLKSLRKVEYLTNCRPLYMRRVRKFLAYRTYNKWSQINGFTIPINTFGPGLSIAHRGTIVVNGGACIGANCRIHVCVNIGTTKGFSSSAPKIGNNVYIGPGAKIFGPIEIADDCIIGANAVVNKSCLVKGAKILGVPGKIYAPA